ncbi:hypothetical protein COW77_00165 [Candidatus Wolfebacteria bacterium CG18_big_fil_WC_8_21_14_2_50_39_7]|nr:MAG: hypothetical protein COW77_00165 [Candidatus Wolfebacteria bacterium CG18_big_fil_WC_8_21_14_2_50_39_7]
MGNQDIRWSEEHVVAGQKFCNKIWNSARFALLQILNSIITKQIPRGSFQISKTIKPKTTADKKILNQLTKIKKSTEKDLDNYRFGQALHKLYEFFWHNFCDKYIEISKKQMADDKLQKNTQEILIYILLSSLKLLHPFMPFITEEIYQQLPIKNKKMLMIEKW